MRDGLKLGLFGLHRGSSADLDTLHRRARVAEELGFESLWVGDHLALPAESEVGVDPGDQPRLEAVVVLAHLAAVASRVRLATGVLVRVGVGHVAAELAALGASLADRGARTDECLAALRALWNEPTPTFAGRFTAFAGVIERPRPAQRPHPPIVISGHAPAALRRAALAGNGRYGWDLDLDQTARALAGLREAASRHCRPADLGEMEISITLTGAIDIETARRYADLGVHRLILQPPTMEGAAIDELIATVGDTLVGRI